MLQMLMQNLQLLYHNHQQQVYMENYMNYMLLNPPWGINRRATMATMLGGLLRCFWCILWRKYSATYRPGICTPALSSGLVWTEDFFYIVFGSFAFRLRLRVNGVLDTENTIAYWETQTLTALNQTVLECSSSSASMQKHICSSAGTTAVEPQHTATRHTAPKYYIKTISKCSVAGYDES